MTSLFQSVQIALGVLFLLREIHLSPGEIGLVNTTGPAEAHWSARCTAVARDSGGVRRGCCG
ncbi:hypothetical protein [Amycolatopsis sp. GM8]|uniref:hypothetical protein n=1 Tax=Amycolatopsis sp. GM8 TaxID=2896530 RepID=UPI001F236C45|nr:hypothetical protein [Amycolatopsis sp. GM8]